MRPILLGKIKDGEVHLEASSRLDAQKHNGARVEIQITTPARIRSIQQNKYLWAVIYKILSDYTGYTPEEIHQDLAGYFLGYKKKGRKYRKSTTELSTVEFGEYIEKIKEYVRNSKVLKHLIIPNPNE